jgi:hypothetical protein
MNSVSVVLQLYLIITTNVEYSSGGWVCHISQICEYNFFITYIIIITMARQPYMGLSLLFPRLLGLVHLWQSVTTPLAALFDSILM